MIIKLVAVIIYFIILFCIGVWASKKVHSIEDFFVAGKKLGYWLVSFSSRATGESGWLLLGLTGLGFAIGIHAIWVVLGEVMFVCFAWVFMVRRFKFLTDKYNSITIPDYLEDRFEDRTHILRIVSALILCIFITAYISGQYGATGKAFEGFLNINYNTGVIIGFAIVLFYTVAGGFFAVAMSDLVQGIMMLSGLIIIPIVSIAACGGIENMFNIIRNIDPKLLSIWHGERNLINIVSALGLVSIGLGFLGSPQLFVRFISVKNEQELIKGSIVSVFFTILADVGAVFTGMAGRAFYFNIKAKYMILTASAGAEEKILPFLANDMFSPILTGFFIAVVLAAIMSTADSLLVVASSSIVRDIYQKIINPNAGQKKLTFLSRIITLILSLIALFFALKNIVPFGFIEKMQKVIFWFILFGWAGITASFCPIILFSIFCKKITRIGAICSMLSGAIITIIFKLIPVKFLSFIPGLQLFASIFGKDINKIEHLSDIMYEMIPAFFISSIVLIIVSLFTEKPKTIDTVFKEMRGKIIEIYD